MSTATAYDRSSIFRAAWQIARDAAARTGEAVRLFIGNALKMSWGRARADRIALSQQQQAEAVADRWSVAQDHHTNAVIDHTIVDQMPVLIHHGGRYPSLVHADGRTTKDAMHVSVWVGGTSFMDGSRVPGTDVPVRVYAHDGFNINRKVYNVVSTDEVDAIAQAMARIGEATAAARTIRAEQDAFLAAVRPVQSLPHSFSRDEYEAACAEYGVEAYEDAVAEGRQSGAWWPTSTVETTIREMLAAKRGVAVRREAEQRRQEKEVAWADARSALIQRLRAQPVHRLTTMILVGPVPEEHLRGGELWTVVERGPDVKIDDGSSSIHGEHLLGYEGCTGREITFEVRREG